MGKKKIKDFPDFPAGIADDNLILAWDVSTGKTRKLKMSALPFLGGNPGAPVTMQSGLWKVRINSPGFTYDATSGNSTISDLRLIGIDDAAVSSTQVGSEFRDDQMNFDATAGTLTLINFQLVGNNHITVNINGAANYAYNVALQNALNTLKNYAAMLAPITPNALGANGGKVLWMRPANEIPIGWQECISIRGFFPLAQNPNDPDFAGTVGTATGGSKSKKLIVDNLPEHSHGYKAGGSLSGIPADRIEADQIKRDDDIGIYFGPTRQTDKAGKADPDAINLMNPYRIVMWIEYVGVN